MHLVPKIEDISARPIQQTASLTSASVLRPELTKRPNFTYRVKIDISASVEKPQVANFRTTGETDRVYRIVFKVSLRLRTHRSYPGRESCVFQLLPHPSGLNRILCSLAT